MLPDMKTRSLKLTFSRWSLYSDKRGFYLQLDAGVPEKIMLTSRDEASVFIVSYAELKRQFAAAFHELVTAGQSMGYT